MDEKLNIYKDLSLFKIIFDVLEKTLTSDTCTLMYIASPGSSPSKVYMFKDSKNKMYAVKLCNIKISRVKLQNERKNKEFLKPYLLEHLPKIIGTFEVGDYELMISECKGVDSLYTSLINNKKTMDFHYKIWKNFLKELMSMWNLSKGVYISEKNPRNNIIRIKRIEAGLLNAQYNGYTLKELWDKTIVINNKEYFSLSKAFDIIKTIGTPKFGITCHGDPQPSNIIIDEQGNWFLVDWEWSGNYHDYRMMFSHLYGWWNTRMTFLKKESKFVVTENKIIINYTLINNEIVNIFQKEAHKSLKKYFKITKNDVLDINKFLALLYLGDARFLSVWGKENYLPVLISEAIKTLEYTIKKEISRVDTRFTFINEME